LAEWCTCVRDYG